MRILKLKSGGEIQVKDNVFEFIKSKYLDTGKDAKLVLGENHSIRIWEIVDFSDRLDDSLFENTNDPIVIDPVKQLRLTLEKKGVLKK